MSVAHLCRMSEDEARAYLEHLRWGDTPACVQCGSTNVYLMQGASTRAGLRKCRDCRFKFTVTMGTIMERSHIALQDWLYAYARMCSSKKGISAKQLERELGVGYKTAWFLCHRIRESMTSVQRQLSSIVEVDETYVGGKPRKRNNGKHQTPSKRGRGTAKTPVVAAVERSGEVRTQVVCDVTAHTLRDVIDQHVQKFSKIITDDFRGYNAVSIPLQYRHSTITHSDGEYATWDGVHTNTVEGFFSLLKRGVYGTYHQLSKKHLQGYCNEFAFKYNNRALCDSDVLRKALLGAEGKRLMFTDLTALQTKNP